MKKRLHVPVFATGSLIVLCCSLGLSSISASPLYTKEVLAEGAPISGGVNGIIIDTANDQLYAASFFGGKILRIDRETGEILEEFDEFGVGEHIEGPDDLSIGSDGSLYWTDVWTGKVGRLSPPEFPDLPQNFPQNRSFMGTQFIVDYVNPITFSDNGRLFVAADVFQSGVYELDPDLIAPPYLIEGLEDVFLNGMDFGPDGLLYGPVIIESKLISVDVEQGMTTLITDEDLPAPAAVKFDSQGNMFTVDASSGEILRIDPQTGDKEVIAQGGVGLDQIAFDSDDRLFVSNANDGSIIEVLPNGNTRIVTEPGMYTPGGIAVLPRVSGSRRHVKVSVFVADAFSVREFDGKTGTLRNVKWIFDGNFFGSMTASADGDNLVLSSWLFNSVQILNAQTLEVVNEGFDWGFATPINAIRFQGDLVVAEYGKLPSGELLVPPGVIKVTSTNERISLTDGYAEEDKLVVPAGLAARGGDLWVSDQATGKILQIINNGRKLQSPIVVAEGLSSPEGIAVYKRNRLLVVEAGANRLSSVHVKSGKKRTIATGFDIGRQGPSTAPPTFIFNDVTVDSSGVIYMTAEIDNVVYRITRR